MNNIKKKITATFLTTLMILSVFTAFVTPVGATGATPGESHNRFTPAAGVDYPVLLGQVLNLTDLNATTTVTFTGMVGAAAGHTFALPVGPAPANLTIVDTVARAMRTGIYNVTANRSIAPVGLITFRLFVDAPILTIDTRFHGTSVTSVAEGSNVTLNVTTNIAGGDRGDIILTDPIGNIHRVAPNNWTVAGHSQNALRDINMTNISAFVLNTTGLRHGTWTIQVRTVADRAQGLSASSNIVSLRIVDPAVAISATRTAIVTGERTTFTVTGVAGHNVTITTLPTGEARVIPHLNDFTTKPTAHSGSRWSSPWTAHSP
ncbi:MAG: hypothetical protein BME93_05210 [Methanosarcinales archaeon Met12]|nr:MAG: hypothetical protein BME93_05210 [Methanosarcinales archaeon Met12]